MSPTKSDFSHLGLPRPLVEALAKQGVTSPFPVQMMAIPDALAGRDVSGEAPTGSGKTLAFGLPLLARTGKGTRNRPRALVLAPTRELADQINKELAPLASSIDRQVIAVYGGVGYGPQKNAIRRGADLLVATPGRLEDLMAQGSVELGDVDIVVVDEADRMADMGFLPAVRRILDRTRSDRQTLLFSATLDGDVAVLARNYQTDPVVHQAAATRQTVGTARHHFWLVENQERVEHTARLIEQSPRSIVFTRTRHRADRLAKQLDRLGIRAVAIHGGRSQSQRTRALESFSEGRAHALIATDVAARGIHVDDVSSVIHYDLPADSTDYLHRSGRTARAGADGTVVTMITRDQRRALVRIQRELALTGPIGPPASLSLAPAEPSQPQGIRPAHQQAVKSVFVKNLPWKTTATDLETLFARHGQVIQSRIVTDERGRSKGFGFVDMADDHARRAITALHGTSLGGRPMTVLPARGQPAR